jgi:ubiquitin carboxyl-terminal hydrolase 8
MISQTDERFYLTGLDNLGNTCYMNSSLQALNATLEFREYILSNKDKGPLHCSLSKLFKRMANESVKNSISPLEFRDRFADFKPQFKGRAQHDSQEFLRFIIDGIHEEVNVTEPERSKRIKKPEPKSANEAFLLYVKYVDNSSLVKIFVGQLTSVIKCTQCQYQSYCWDTFWDISLSLPKGDKECDINDCIKEYTAEEVLDSDSMPNCSQCKQKRKSIKSLQFETLPLILILQLKKFENDGQKISRDVNINDKILINSEKYVLYACICHKGISCVSGHYNCFCKYNLNEWHFFDDETVTLVKDFNYDQLKNAYILFYRKEGKTLYQ